MENENKNNSSGSAPRNYRSWYEILRIKTREKMQGVQSNNRSGGDGGEGGSRERQGVGSRGPGRLQGPRRPFQKRGLPSGEGGNLMIIIFCGGWEGGLQ